MAMSQSRADLIDDGKPQPTGDRTPQMGARPKAVTWRSVLVCLILLPINSYWVVQMEVIRYSAHPTTISLFFNTIFILLCLTLLNRAVGRVLPGAVLQRGEMLLIYSVLAIGSCVSATTCSRSSSRCSPGPSSMPTAPTDGPP